MISKCLNYIYVYTTIATKPCSLSASSAPAVWLHGLSLHYGGREGHDRITDQRNTVSDSTVSDSTISDSTVSDSTVSYSTVSDSTESDWDMPISDSTVSQSTVSDSDSPVMQL